MRDCKRLPRVHVMGCQGVKLLFPKYFFSSVFSFFFLKCFVSFVIIRAFFFVWLYISLVLRMSRMFYYLMGFFCIILASLVPKCSIIRYLRCHLGFCDLLWCHFGIYWSKSRHHQSCFGIFGLSFLASWHFWHFWHFGILRFKSRHH